MGSHEGLHGLPTSSGTRLHGLACESGLPLVLFITDGSIHRGLLPCRQASPFQTLLADGAGEHDPGHRTGALLELQTRSRESTLPTHFEGGADHRAVHRLDASLEDVLTRCLGRCSRFRPR